MKRKRKWKKGERREGGRIGRGRGGGRVRERGGGRKEKREKVEE